jgi:hypothetical protein
VGGADLKIENEMMRYLLEELPAEETDRFEERYFTDDETFDRLLMVKSDLIDRYLHGQLDKEETDKFESFFLQAPSHRQEVALVRSLLKMESTARLFAAPPAIVPNEPASLIEKIFGALPAWGRRLAAGTFAALLIVGFAWLLIANRRMQNELSLASVFAITLAPGQSRSPGVTNQYDLPAGTRKIQLRLLLDRDFDYRSYAVTLKNTSHKTIQTGTGSRVSGDVVIAEFSADKLQPGAYVATLSGASANGQMEEIADYPFRIAKQ